MRCVTAGLTTPATLQGGKCGRSNGKKGPLDPSLPYQGVEKQESGRQARRAAMRQAQHIQAYVSIGESRATLHGGLRCSFSTACYTEPVPIFYRIASIHSENQHEAAKRMESHKRRGAALPPRFKASGNPVFAGLVQPVPFTL